MSQSDSVAFTAISCGIARSNDIRRLVIGISSASIDVWSYSRLASLHQYVPQQIFPRAISYASAGRSNPVEDVMAAGDLRLRMNRRRSEQRPVCWLGWLSVLVALLTLSPPAALAVSIVVDASEIGRAHV